MRKARRTCLTPVPPVVIVHDLRSYDPVEHQRRRDREAYRRNVEHERALKRAHYQKNRERILARLRERYHADAERHRERMRQRYAANPEPYRKAAARRYGPQVRDAVRLYKRAVRLLRAVLDVLEPVPRHCSPGDTQAERAALIVRPGPYLLTAVPPGMAVVTRLVGAACRARRFL